MRQRPPDQPALIPDYLLRDWSEEGGVYTGLDKLARLLGGEIIEVTINTTETKVTHNLERIPGDVIWFRAADGTSQLEYGTTPWTHRVVYLKTTSQQSFKILLA